MKAGPSIGSYRSRFKEFAGAILNWRQFVVSHSALGLIAERAPRGRASILFLHTRYLDCPLRMHNVRLRLATEEETELLRSRIPDGHLTRLECEDHLVIDCDEGRGVIVAKVMFVAWRDSARKREMTDAELQFLQRGYEGLDGPLWPDGPPLAEL